MLPHSNSELLRAIADGLLIERDSSFQEGESEWRQCLPDIALTLIAQGRAIELRIKPLTIKIGDTELIGPLTEPPENNDIYWLLSLQSKDITSYAWENSVCEERWLKSGLIYATEAQAEAVKMTLIKLLRNT